MPTSLMSTASTEGDGQFGFSLVLSLIKFAMRGCSPGTASINEYTDSTVGSYFSLYIGGNIELLVSMDRALPSLKADDVALSDAKMPSGLACGSRRSGRIAATSPRIDLLGLAAMCMHTYMPMHGNILKDYWF